MVPKKIAIAIFSTD